MNTIIILCLICLFIAMPVIITWKLTNQLNKVWYFLKHHKELGEEFRKYIGEK